MHRRAPLTGIIVLALAGSLAAVQAAGTMSERQARSAAAKILKGDPYGNTPDQIAQNIVRAQLLMAGATRCGTKVTKPVWQFHVVVPKNRNPSGDSKIDGFLAIDAGTGKLICAGLPFLD